MVTQEILKQLLHYNPISGKLYWKHRDISWFKRHADFLAWNNRYAGSEAFTSNSNNYLQGTILGKRYIAHRIIWLYMTGTWPLHTDHINGDTRDNRFKNLREVTPQENLKNRRLSCRNKSGYHGVFFRESVNKWEVYINNEYQSSFIRLDDAVKFRKILEDKYGYHKNHGRSNV